MSDQVVSFLSKDDAGQGRKHKYKKPFVSINYSSGSDGDDESDPASAISPAKKLKRSKKSLAKHHKSKEVRQRGDSAEDDEETQEEQRVSSDGEDNQKPVPGAGWADVMSKILGRPAATTTPLVLSKSKAYSKAKDAEKEELETKHKLDELKKQRDNIGREKPQPLKKDVEKKLQRIAVRGVVQFFNAVGKQQKLREEKLKEATTENKRIKTEASLTKGDFLDMLKTSKENSNTKGNKVSVEEEEKPAWSVLKEDFMIGATMKDWDKGTKEDEEETAVQEESSSESDDNNSE